MNRYVPSHWTEYALIDSGGLEKLERFGKFILARPEPQAVWKKALPEKEWEELWHACYKRTRGTDPARSDSFEKGTWIRKKNMPDQWKISYSYREMNLHFRLGLTAFGHIGVFPEQAENWDFIYDTIRQARSGSTLKKPVNQPRILNLFAYTGGASLAARAAGAEVVHVDSVRPVINWAREMMELTGLDGIRWVVEDALKFVQREVRRGNRYDGIILDPPAYGRGPDGEKWMLQEGVDEMIGCCHQLLHPGNSFLILSLYSMGFSTLISENLIRSHFGSTVQLQSGELCFTDKAGRILPLGTMVRMLPGH